MIRASTMKKREVERLGVKVLRILKSDRGFRLTVVRETPRLPGEYRREAATTIMGNTLARKVWVFVSA